MRKARRSSRREAVKIEFKIGKKKYRCQQTKRNVKIWLTGEDQVPVMKEWDLDEMEPMLPNPVRKLVYFAEFWNGVLEYVNNVKAKAVQE